MFNGTTQNQDQVHNNVSVRPLMEDAGQVNSNSNVTTSSYRNTSTNREEEDVLCEICDGRIGFPVYIVVVQLLLAIFMLTFNLLTMVAVYRCRTMTPSIRMGLLNLSVTDVAASLAFGYHVILSWFGSHEVGLECVIRYVIFVSLIVLTQTTVSFVSVDRLLSVAMTYRYQTLATPTYVKSSIVSLWLLTAVIVAIGFAQLRRDPEACFYPLLVLPEIHIFYACVSLLNIAAIVCINTHLFRYARRQASKIAPTLVGMTSEARGVQVARMAVKSIKTTTSVVMPFVLLNTPMYVFYFYLGFDQEIGTTVLGLGLTNILSSLVISNSIVNPFVYVWRSHEVRAEIKKMRASCQASCRRD